MFQQTRNFLSFRQIQWVTVKRVGTKVCSKRSTCVPTKACNWCLVQVLLRTDNIKPQEQCLNFTPFSLSEILCSLQI